MTVKKKDVYSSMCIGIISNGHWWVHEKYYTQGIDSFSSFLEVRVFFSHHRDSSTCKTSHARLHVMPQKI